MWITIVICTWNRAQLLRGALDSLEGINPPTADGWDILVVDNNSSDDTADVVQNYAGRLPVSRVVETRQGLSHARNLACSTARGDYLIFTDDDVIVDQELLAEYSRAFAAHPAAAFFGGPIEPKFVAKPPRWLAANFTRFASAYALRSGSSGLELLTDATFLPYGANMAFSRSVLRHAPFLTDLGRTGVELIGGEETEFMGRLLASGHHGVWVGAARVQHLIAKDRMTKSYIWNYFLCQGKVQVRRHQHGLDKTSIRQAKKKVRKWRRELSLSFARDESWANKFAWCATLAGQLQELDAHQNDGVGARRAGA